MTDRDTQAQFAPDPSQASRAYEEDLAARVEDVIARADAALAEDTGSESTKPAIAFDGGFPSQEAYSQVSAAKQARIAQTEATKRDRRVAPYVPNAFDGLSPTPFRGLLEDKLDIFGLVRHEDKLYIAKERLMATAGKLADILIDTKQERQSIEEGNLTRVQHIELRDDLDVLVYGYGFSVKRRPDGQHEYWFERTDPAGAGSGFVLRRKEDHSVLISLAELNTETEAIQLVQRNNDGVQPTEMELVEAATRALHTFAEGSGIDPKTLKPQEKPANAARVDSHMNHSEIARRALDRAVQNIEARNVRNERLRRIMRTAGGVVAAAAVVVGLPFIGQKAYEYNQSVNADRAAAEVARESQEQANEQQEQAAAQFAQPPAETFRLNEDYTLSYLSKDSYATASSAPEALQPDDNANEFKLVDGLQKIQVTTDSTGKIVLRGDFSQERANSIAMFHQDPTLNHRLKLNIEYSGRTPVTQGTRYFTVTPINGGDFVLGDTFYVWMG